MNPLISCLCVTKNRTDQLKRAISLFKAQTYSNKELVIVLERGDLATEKIIRDIDDPRIRTVLAPSEPGMTLGRLRNLSIEKAKGAYFCQWDDDDWHHPRRLELQYRTIHESDMPASVLLSWLIFNRLTSTAYLSCSRPWEGSLLCRKDIFAAGIQYKDVSVGEDTIVVRKLFSRHLVFPVIMPKLYIYVYHGRNAWEYRHWRTIFEASAPLSKESGHLIRDILDDKYNVDDACSLLDGIKK